MSGGSGGGAPAAAKLRIATTGPHRRLISGRSAIAPVPGRLDPGRARDDGGAGLGLPIARALARARGGELACLPREGGAQFRLSLPIDAGLTQ